MKMVDSVTTIPDEGLWVETEQVQQMLQNTHELIAQHTQNLLKELQETKREGDTEENKEDDEEQEDKEEDDSEDRNKSSESVRR